ncbi:hypothetical protein AN477_16205 [Alicyclobacillus ferrooxydans]|uniref:Uncharacterized protein n=1 Tax=Alicyclobacillus ferrooxydans TaxID=471514 RepID=A0A0P9EIM9_9BACL|nr:hypothetical protein AN477_16205 [Alicyclobacillus ferrooxydans]
MRKVSEKLYASFTDPFTIRRFLNQLAEEFSNTGCVVRRGQNGSVFITLPDKVLHFVPDNDIGVKRITFRYT